MPRIAAIILALLMLFGFASAEGALSSDLQTSTAPVSGAAAETADPQEPVSTPDPTNSQLTASASPDAEATETAETAENDVQKSGDFLSKALQYWFILPILAALVVIAVLVIKKPKPQMTVTAGEPFVSAVGNVHGIGKRGYQQDSFGVSDFSNKSLIENNGVLSVLADGMGGLSMSGDISQTMVRQAIGVFNTESGTQREMLLKICANAVRCAKEQFSSVPKTGTTFIAASVIHGNLDFISIGDSRIALIRGGKLITLNRAHNYGALLDTRAAATDVTIQEAKANPKRAALTSYLGMDNLKTVDMPIASISLAKGDTIVLMSDGVFGTLDDAQIAEYAKDDVYKGAESISQAVENKGDAYQDNFTAILLRVD